MYHKVGEVSGPSVTPRPSSDALDVFAMIDTIAKCMYLEDRECSKVGELALGLILDTATVLIGDKDKVQSVVKCSTTSLYKSTNYIVVYIDI